MAKVMTSDETFGRDLEANGEYVLVDFGAPWCPPCRPFEKTLDAVSNEVSVPLLYVDADENPHTASTFGVRSLPTVIVFRRGVPVGQLVGNQAKAKVLEMLRTAGHRTTSPTPAP